MESFFISGYEKYVNIYNGLEGYRAVGNNYLQLLNPKSFDICLACSFTVVLPDYCK
jgi:hypothetical protein